MSLEASLVSRRGLMNVLDVQNMFGILYGAHGGLEASVYRSSGNFLRGIHFVDFVERTDFANFETSVLIAHGLEIWLLALSCVF